MDEEKNTHNAGTEPGSTPAEDSGAALQIQELQARIEELQRSADSTRDQLLRKAAEFENYRRRVENDIANIVKNANEGLITALLPILDDLVRSLAQGKEAKDSDAFTKGVELIYAKLLRVLEQQGLTPFDSVGKPFDVDYHDALLQVVRNDVPHHTVVEEVERGYKLREKVLRHAKVIVSSAPDTPEEAIPGNGEETNDKGK